MELLEKTWIELQSEVGIVAASVQRWWGRMSQDEQYILLGVVCAAALLMVIVRKPAKKSNTRGYDNSSKVMTLAQQFTFAAVILVVFTFGIDSALDGIT